MVSVAVHLQNVCFVDNNPSGQQERRAKAALTSPPSETEKKGRKEGEEEGEGGGHVVNTCLLRGNWSTANLFTHRLTTQEPFFLSLPFTLPPSLLTQHILPSFLSSHSSSPHLPTTFIF